MKNLTLAIEDDLLAEARTIAAEDRTTVNALVRGFIRDLVDQRGRGRQARKRLLELIDTSDGDMGSQRWNREALYDR